MMMKTMMEMGPLMDDGDDDITKLTGLVKQINITNKKIIQNQN